MDQTQTAVSSDLKWQPDNLQPQLSLHALKHTHGQARVAFTLKIRADQTDGSKYLRNDDKRQAST